MSGLGGHLATGLYSCTVLTEMHKQADDLGVSFQVMQPHINEIK